MIVRWPGRVDQWLKGSKMTAVGAPKVDAPKSVLAPFLLVRVRFERGGYAKSERRAVQAAEGAQN